MLATVSGKVVRIQPGEAVYPARNGRAEKIEKFTEVTLLQTVPNPFQKGQTDLVTIAVRSFNGAHEKLKVGEDGSLPCVIRGFTSSGKVVLAADCR
jgi:hypothetical protein